MSGSHAQMIEDANRRLLVEGDLEAADDYFAADYVAHTARGDLPGGPSGVRRFLTTLFKAFSDVDVEVDILLESGDRIAWQRTVRATHSGAFQGFPATGRALVWRDMLTSRMEDGRIAEEWAVSDLAEALLLARKAGG